MSPRNESSDTVASFVSITDMVEDLVRRWERYGELIIAVDFDDTIYNYRDNPMLNLVPLQELLKECVKCSMKVVIFTARPKSEFKFIEGFCGAIKLKIEGININILKDGDSNRGVGESGKIYYNLLLDDKAGLQQAYFILKRTYLEIQKRLNGKQNISVASSEHQ